MGMFDRLNVACPECFCQVEFQSKAGPCTLADYTLTDVDPGVAGDLDGDSETCEKCGATVYLRLVTRPTLEATTEEPGSSKRFCSYCGRRLDSEGDCTDPICGGYF